MEAPELKRCLDGATGHAAEIDAAAAWLAAQAGAEPTELTRAVLGYAASRYPYLCRHDCELVANWMTRP
jgi:hypothetical protein